MTEENLLNIKNNYKKLSEYNNNLTELLNIKEEMETLDIVKRYKSILDALEVYKIELNNEQRVLSQEEMLGKVIESELITETNGIYVYQCSYHRYYQNGQKRMVGYYRVPVDDSRADYHVYMDIEKGINCAPTEIPAYEREQFEANNHVIYPKNMLPIDCYNEVRREFFKTALIEDEEKAIQKVLGK